MKKTLFIISFLFLSIKGFAQQSESANAYLSSKNSVYLELLGTGTIYSFNFDRIVFSNKPVSIAARFGITYSPVAGAFNRIPAIGFPFELTGLVGQKDSKLELGIGMAYHYLLDDPSHFSILILVPRIGYRLHKNQGGLFIKTGFTPWIPIVTDNERIEPNFVPMIGFAIGHTFE